MSKYSTCIITFLYPFVSYVFITVVMEIKNGAAIEPRRPINFSWVIEGRLAAMGFPSKDSNLAFLVQNGISRLVTLTGSWKPKLANFPEVDTLSVDVEEFEPPTLDQIVQCIQYIEESLALNKAVGVHCAYGRGRTGTIVSCFLVKSCSLDPDSAIDTLRSIRPGSVETGDQEDMVHTYSEHIRRSGVAGTAHGTSRQINHTIVPKRPFNFSWVIDGRLAAMGFPDRDSNIAYLVKNDITRLVTLTGDWKPNIDKFPEMSMLVVDVEEFEPPTLDQIKQCVEYIEESVSLNKAAGVHCAFGRGRTGVIVASYFVKLYNLDPDEAIERLRAMRPWSVETSEQEEVVRTYARHVRYSGKAGRATGANA